MVKWVKYLTRDGVNCEVLTRSHPDPKYRDESLLDDCPEDLTVHRIPLAGSPAWSVWQLALKIYSLGGGRRYRWLVTTSPGERSILYGFLLSRLFSLQWHCDLRDPIEGKGGWLKQCLVSGADWVTTAWPVETLLGNSGTVSTRWIPNGFDPDYCSPEGHSQRHFDRPVRLVHTGSLYGPDQDPATILESLSRLVDDHGLTAEDVQLRFMGAITDDHLAETLPELIRERGLDSIVTVSGFVSHAESMDALEWADVGLVFHGKPALSYKFVEYLGAGLPVVCYYDPNSPMASVARGISGVHWVNWGDRVRLDNVLSQLLVERRSDRPGRNDIERFSLPSILEPVRKRYQWN